jgi:hypothetical protein
MEAKRARIYWLCQFAGWFVYLGLWLLPAVYATDQPQTSAGPLVLAFAAQAVISIAWTHGYRYVIHRAGWITTNPVRLVPRAALGCVLVGLAIAVSSISLSSLYRDPGRPLRAWLPWAVATSVFNVVLWTTVYFGVHYVWRLRQAERDKRALTAFAAEAKLDVLRSQLNPHFLFNCLNSVRALIIEDPARAHTAVTALSTLLRYSLQATHVATVPLDDELEIVRTYLVLEAIRFEDRLRCEIDVGAQTGRVPIPPMLVQSLVENGVKHGIEQLPAGGVISVASWLDRDALHVRVTNTGEIARREGSTQVGLANSRERLRLIYGPRASLAMRQDGRQVIAELSVPVAGAP